MKKVITFFLLLFFGFTSITYSAQPLESLKTPIDEVIRILTDKKYNNPALKKEQQDTLWKVINGVFDFKLISKLVLGKYRKQFSKNEIKEFTELFTELLGSTYIGKLQEGFKNEKVTYIGQELISEKKALVQTTIMRNDVKIPIDYSMRLNKGAWKIYDVKIEGVSLVKNYRTQFKTFLTKKSPAELITHLKEKGVNVPEKQGEATPHK